MENQFFSCAFFSFKNYLKILLILLSCKGYKYTLVNKNFRQLSKLKHKLQPKTKIIFCTKNSKIQQLKKLAFKFAINILLNNTWKFF